MEIVLHLGAHRTATTSFQAYLRKSRHLLAGSPLRVWGPRDTRGGIFAGLFPERNSEAANVAEPRHRALGRLSMHLDKARQTGVETLLISDENMIGNARQCHRTGVLYPAIGERMARIGAAFDGRVTKVVLGVRALDQWWPSAMAFAISRGALMPGHTRLESIASSPRGWRDVITDVACALPDAEITVAPFEHWAGRQAEFLSQITGHRAPICKEDIWLNRCPDAAALREILTLRGQDHPDLPEVNGLWAPFSTQQAQALRETYEDDMFWLAAGADGLATMTEDRARKRTGINLSAVAQHRGLMDDEGTGSVARTG